MFSLYAEAVTLMQTPAPGGGNYGPDFLMASTSPYRPLLLLLSEEGCPKSPRRDQAGISEGTIKDFHVGSKAGGQPTSMRPKRKVRVCGWGSLF